MKRIATLLMATACSASAAPSSPVDASTPFDASGFDGGGADQRGLRYCEILLGTVGATTVHLSVYTTHSVSDCPADQWAKVDVAALKASSASDVVVLNGPRYWTIDSLAGSALLDPTVKDIGGMQMVQAGAIDLPLADLTTVQKPYTNKSIHRDAQFHWWPGKTVFELLDGGGHVYTMQSYSVQKDATLTQDSLAGLGARLTNLPTGWSYRTRTLTSELVVTAVNQQSTVTQDELGNTYSQSQ